MNRSAIVLTVLFAFSAGCSDPGFEPVAKSEKKIEATIAAAVQYNEGDAAMVDTKCASSKTPDACAVLALIAEAQKKGAKLVVTPEYGLGQKYLEADPKVGDMPATDSRWSSNSLIKNFAAQAKTLGIYLVINLQTYAGSEKYNAQVAFDPTGKVVARHHKFELFASESKSLTPGNDVSVFETPMGKVGLLICADMYGDLRRHDELVNTLGARIIAVSSLWTAQGAPRWPANFAKNWGVYVVSSNTTYGTGKGGGVFGPDGSALAVHEGGKPALVSATIPAK